MVSLSRRIGSSNKLVIVGAHLLYFLALQAIFSLYIVDLFGYEGYVDDFIVEKSIFSAMSVVVMSALIKSEMLPSVFFLNLALILIVSPSLVVFSGSNISIDFAFVTVTSFLLLLIASSFFSVRVKLLLPISEQRLVFFLLAGAGTVVLAMIAFGGMQYLNFDLAAVYDIRREAASNLPPIFAYLISPATKVLIPFGIVLALIQKKYSLVAAFAFLSMMFFGLSAHKGPLFYPFIVLVVYWAAGGRHFVVSFLAVMVVLVVVSLIDFDLAGRGEIDSYGWFGSIVARRALIVPSFLNSCYVDFFSGRGAYYFWSESKVTLGLLTPPYSVGPPQLIGSEYFGRDEMSANVGWIGSGFANAGYVGSYLYSVILGVGFAFFDAAARRLGFRLVVSLMVVQIMTIINSTDLLTVMITHGLLLSMFLLLCIRGQR